MVRQPDAHAVGLCEGLQNEESYLILQCARCCQILRLCRTCYHGNRYCIECATLARVDSKRRARTRYQKTPNGKEQHRIAQQRCRRRKEDRTEVLQPAVEGNLTNDSLSDVMDQSMPLEAEDPVISPPIENRLSQWQHTLVPAPQTIVCDLCAAPCGFFALRPV